MTPSDRPGIEAWLLSRLKRARSQYETAKKEQSHKTALSHDAPSPDGTLMREQARAGAELTQYAKALRDHTALVVHGQLSAELLAEWRQTQRPERKPFGGAEGSWKRRQEA